MSIPEKYDADTDCFSLRNNVASVLKFGAAVRGPADISVVIPTYRRPEYLEEALGSIVRQDTCGLVIEIIIVDNDCYDLAGTDTLKVLQRYAASNLFYYQNEANIGMFGNWNRCFELASADWVSMLHDDDFLAEGYFRHAKDILEKAEKDPLLFYVKAKSLPVVYGEKPEMRGLARLLCSKSGVSYMTIGKRYLDFIGPNKVGLLGACSCGSLMKRSVYMKFGGFNEEFYPSADAYYPARIISKHGYRAGYTVNVLGYNRMDDNTSLKESTILAWAEQYMMYSVYYSTRGAISGAMYAIFREEMGAEQRGEYGRYVEMSRIIPNKESLHAELERIMLFEPSRFRLAMYRGLYLSSYRAKQLVAVLRALLATAASSKA